MPGIVARPTRSAGDNCCDELLRRSHGRPPATRADVALIDDEHDHPAAGRRRIRAVVRRRRRARGLARRRDVLRRDEAARLAVDRQREIVNLQPRNRPAVAVDDVDVDRDEIDGRAERRRRRWLLSLRRRLRGRRLRRRILGRQRGGRQNQRAERRSKMLGHDDSPGIIAGIAGIPGVRAPDTCRSQS